jgi:hypothetical protein
LEHEPAFPSEYRPAAHGIQDDEETAAYVPAAQEVHAPALLFEYDPALHAEHEPDPPAA